MKKWTDAKFEVVKGPEPDNLPQWFKTLVLWLATLFLLGIPVWKFNEAHRAPPVPADAAPAPQQAPSAQ